MQVVSGMSGESEATLRALFQEARSVAPSIIFIGTTPVHAEQHMQNHTCASILVVCLYVNTCIVHTLRCADEIDAIMPKREAAQREMERRIVAQMLTCMDDLSGGGTDTVEGQQTEENGTPVDGRNAHVVVIGMSWKG